LGYLRNVLYGVNPARVRVQRQAARAQHRPVVPNELAQPAQRDGECAIRPIAFGVWPKRFRQLLDRHRLRAQGDEYLEKLKRTLRLRLKSQRFSRRLDFELSKGEKPGLVNRRPRSGGSKISHFLVFKSEIRERVQVTLMCGLKS
jgi:hypothetical protein